MEINSELRAEYKRLAKAADRRLRNLEKAVKREGFESITKFAYAKAMADIEHRFGEGEVRFDKVLPASYSKMQIQAAIADVESFMRSPSSTISGVKGIYAKRANTLSKKLGQKYTWKEIAILFENSTFDRLVSKMSSDQVFKQISSRLKKKKKLAKEIEESNKKITHTGAKENLQDVINDMLNESTLSVKDLI